MAAHFTQHTMDKAGTNHVLTTVLFIPAIITVYVAITFPPQRYTVGAAARETVGVARHRR